MLEYIYQNCKIQEDMFSRIIKYTNLKFELKEMLKEMLFNYKKIEKCAEKMLLRRGKQIKNIGVISKMISDFNVKSKMEKEDEEIIQVILNNLEINIIQEMEQIEEMQIKRKSIGNLLERLIQLEKENSEKITDFSKKHLQI